MKTTLIITFISLILLSSCKKFVNCDATAYVKNVGNQTVHYAWGSNYYADSIKPGETASKDVGHIKVGLIMSSTETITFNSDHGNIVIYVDECEVHHEID